MVMIPTRHRNPWRPVAEYLAVSKDWNVFAMELSKAVKNDHFNRSSPSHCWNDCIILNVIVNCHFFDGLGDNMVGRGFKKDLEAIFYRSLYRLG